MKNKFQPKYTRERERERETNPFEREMLHKSFERRETKSANGLIENFFFHFVFLPTAKWSHSYANSGRVGGST